MKVMEIYKAVQGEGQLIGQPSVFVRLFGCNMRCSWCDTAYSINRKEWKRAQHKGSPYTEMTVTDVLDRIEAATLHVRKLNTHPIVITGGEPTIQGEELTTLLKRLYGVNCFITIETNATLLPDAIRTWYSWAAWNKSRILWSLSPKLGSAGPSAQIDLRTIQWFVSNANTQLKFIISDPGDILDACELLRAITFGAKRVPIIFQPNGDVIRRGVQDYLHVLGQLQGILSSEPAFIHHDIRVLPQLHVLLHGQRRFV